MLLILHCRNSTLIENSKFNIKKIGHPCGRPIFFRLWYSQLFDNHFFSFLALTFDVKAGSKVVSSDTYTIEVEEFNRCVIVNFFNGDVLDT